MYIKISDLFIWIRRKRSTKHKIPYYFTHYELILLVKIYLILLVRHKMVKTSQTYKIENLHISRFDNSYVRLG